MSLKTQKPPPWLALAWWVPPAKLPAIPSWAATRAAAIEAPADRLISAGENSGRMGVIDRWVLSNTVQWLSRHKKHLKNTQFVCMNLSGASLNDEKFIQDVFSTLEENIHIAKHLCLEITESVALHDLQNTRRFIDQVRQYGAKVALDDFGAGYTSFSYLKDLPGDLLKIDGSFIVNMNQHPANIAIVEAIVAVVARLGAFELRIASVFLFVSNDL